MDTKLFKIGEIADMLGVSIRAIRIYDKMGLLVPASVDPETGYRYYTMEQLDKLNIVLELKAVGFNLKEIKAILNGQKSYTEINTMFDKKFAMWRDTVADIRNKMKTIKEMKRKVANDSAIRNSLEALPEHDRARVLARMVCVEGTRAERAIAEAIWL
jgi:DNA-binding transcriptional MerR regulator